MNKVLGLFNFVYEQCDLDQFFQTYQMDCHEYIYSQFSYIYCSYNEPVYPIKTFIEFLYNSISIQSAFFSVRINLIDNTLSPKLYSNIVKRQNYYTENPQRILYKKSEPFCEYLQRVLFTNEPPPYHYDFILQKPNDQSKDTLVYTLKQGRGYGYRLPSSGKRTINGSHTGSICSPKRSLLSPTNARCSNRISPVIASNYN